MARRASSRSPASGNPFAAELPRAQAIAASAEAACNPHLALAAIKTGQSLAQFRATFAAGGLQSFDSWAIYAARRARQAL
ncbi:MAG: hypothetical protein ACHP7N_00295 [Caulobacterales bacterium]